MKLLHQEAMIAQQSKKMEAASTLPDFSVGYFNQSLIGTQTINGQDVFFDKSQRFDGFNFGLSFPITFFSSNAKIKSLSLQEQALQKQADNSKLLLHSQLQNTLQQYNQQLQQYNIFKTSALQNATVVINTASLGFRSGDIGYIEYLQALQTASDIQLNYLQAVNQLNQTIINIDYIFNK